MFNNIKEKWGKASLTDQVMAFATCVIAITTIAYTIISIIQITKLSNQIDLTHQALDLNKRQTEATEKALNMAKGSLAVSQKTLVASEKATKLEQSPHITVTDYFVTTHPIDLSKKNSFWIKLTNTGKSPAKQVVTFRILKKISKTTIEQINADIEEAYHEAQRIKKAPPQDISPGSGVFTSIDASTTVDPFSIEEITEVRKSKLSLLFIGGATYHDIFGIEHGTNFCMLYDGEDLSRGSFCAKYNNVY